MTTLVLGASENPQRYSNRATARLLAAGHELVLIGGREGEVHGVPIHVGRPALSGEVDTVTLYLNPARQEAYEEYLLDAVKPRRIIFNPGTENPALERRARAAGIEVERACTLVLLATQTY